jgi:hypothetical protein
MWIFLTRWIAGDRQWSGGFVGLCLSQTVPEGFDGHQIAVVDAQVIDLLAQLDQPAG